MRAAMFLSVSLAASAAAARVPGEAMIFVYAPAPDLQASAFPGLTLRDAKAAGYTGIRFGGRTNDVAYLFYDCAAEYTRHDRLFLFVPGVTRTARLLRGSWKDGASRYRNIRLSGVFENAHADYVIDLTVSTDWQRRKIDTEVEIDCSLRARSKRARFMLRGKLPSTIGAGGPLKASALLAAPALKMTVDRRYHPVMFKGYLESGKLKMIPLSGLKGTALLVVTGTDNKPVQKTKFRAKPRDDSYYFRCEATRKLKPMVPYKAKMTVDLSPLFGELATIEGVVLKED